MSLVLFRTLKRVRQPHRWQRTASKNVSAEGPPLVILSEDGFLYVPIYLETPDKSVRSQTIALRRQVREGKRQTLRARRPAFNLNRENRANHQTPQLQNPHFLEVKAVPEPY